MVGTQNCENEVTHSAYLQNISLHDSRSGQIAYCSNDASIYNDEFSPSAKIGADVQSSGLDLPTILVFV